MLRQVSLEQARAEARLERIQQRFGRPFAPSRLYGWLASGDLPFSIECLAESGNIYPVRSPRFLETVSPRGFAEVAAGSRMHISRYRHSDGALIWGVSPNPNDPVTTCTILVDEDRFDALCNPARAAEASTQPALVETESLTINWTNVKGRVSFDDKALREASIAAGINISEFETVGEPSDRLSIQARPQSCAAA